MKRAIAFLLGFGLALLAGPVLAGDVTLSWTNPDRTFTMTDAGPYENPAGTKIYLEVADTSDPSAESIVLPAMKPGTYNFVAVSYDDQGVASPVSNPATKEVTEFVTTDTTVYYPIPQPNGVLMLEIGSVPLGTPCNPDLPVQQYYAVDRALVTWVGTAEPFLVVAQCG